MVMFCCSIQYRTTRTKVHFMKNVITATDLFCSQSVKDTYNEKEL